MRQIVKTVVLAAAMAAMATAVQPDTTAHGDRLLQYQSWFQTTPYEPFANWTALTSNGDAYRENVPQPTSFGYPLQLVSNGYEAQPKPYFNASQYAPLGDLPPLKSDAEPRQHVSIDHPDVRKPHVLARQLKPHVVRIQFNSPVLAPMAHTLFCLHYPSDCRVRKIAFRGGAFKLTDERRAELEHINAEVNRSIIPKRDTEWLAGIGWLISPKAGDCNDYAVTKRHELLARGWPERALLLSEVVTSWGEHHLVLVVRTSEGDFVADNLNPKIRSWVKAPYRWVRIQSPASPKSWSTVANAAA